MAPLGVASLLATVLALSACDGTPDDHRPGGGTDNDTATADTGVAPEESFLTAEVTPENLATYTFTAGPVIGFFDPDTFAIGPSPFADLTGNRSILFVVRGHGVGTYPITTAGTGNVSTFTDTMLADMNGTFSGESGTLFVSRWEEATFPEASIGYADGTFDVEFSNDTPDTPNAPKKLHVVGEFGNVRMLPVIFCR